MGSPSDQDVSLTADVSLAADVSLTADDSLTAEDSLNAGALKPAGVVKLADALKAADVLKSSDVLKTADELNINKILWNKTVYERKVFHGDTMISATRVLDYASKPNENKTLLLQLLEENLHKDDTDDEDWMRIKGTKGRKNAKKRIAIDDCNDDDDLKPVAKLSVAKLPAAKLLPMSTQGNKVDEEVPTMIASGSPGLDEEVPTMIASGSPAGDETVTNDEDEVNVVTGNPGKPVTGICYPLREGNDFEKFLAKRKLLDGKMFDFLLAMLDCKRCSFYSNGISVMLGNGEYMETCKTTLCWWEQDLVRSHAVLAAHTSHAPNVQPSNIIAPGQQLLQEQCHSLAPGIEHVVSVLHGDLHYCVLVLHVH